MGDELLTADAIKFKIWTRQYDPVEQEWKPSWLKASVGPDGRMRLSGIASSTIKDLHGDTMLASALEDMEKSANNNLTIFGNHSYDVPEDVYGSVEKAVLKQAGTVDNNGDPIYDLAFDVLVNDENPRAVESWKAMNKGIKLGMSIGAMIPEGGATRNKKSGALTIAHVDLLETSIVGIPANPRSWVENAVKSFTKGATTVPLGSPQLTLDSDTRRYTIEGSIDDISSGVIFSAGIGETEEPPEGHVLFSKHEECGVVVEGTFPDGLCTCGSSGPFLAFYAESATTEPAITSPDVAAATCPDCDHGKGDGGSCSNPFHKDVEPDVTDAKITVIEVDTGTPAAAPESDPEGDVDEPVGGDVTDAAGAVVTAAAGALSSLEDQAVIASFQQLLDLTNTLLGELEKGETAKQQAIEERNFAVKTAGDLITQTNALLQRLGSLRLGPKAVVREAASELDDLQGIYTQAFMDMLKSGKETK